MRNSMIVLLIAAGASLQGCGTHVCVTGQSAACACPDGDTGAQICQEDGTYGACQCGDSACNAATCSGCCDATGACQAGTTSSACGVRGQTCISCSAPQACGEGACRTPTAEGGGSGGGGSGGGSGGGGGACGPATCASGCCDASGACRTGELSAACGAGGQACAVCTDAEVCQGGTCSSGSGCASCAPDQICISNACARVKRVFVTRTRYTGELGGLDGGDAKCRLAAEAAQIGGTWKAWLSDGSTNAIDRIADVGPWYAVYVSNGQRRGYKVFNNKANLATVPLGTPAYDELGSDLYTSSAYIWTGTAAGGARTTETCSSWTSDSGYLGTYGAASGLSWTASSTGGCHSMHALLCLEQ